MSDTACPNICPGCGCQRIGTPADVVDLHALIDREGVDEVAEVVNRSPGQVKHLRSGQRPIDIDILHALAVKWPDFDIAASVKRIGARRVSMERNR